MAYRDKTRRKKELPDGTPVEYRLLLAEDYLCEFGSIPALNVARERLGATGTLSDANPEDVRLMRRLFLLRGCLSICGERPVDVPVGQEKDGEISIHEITDDDFGIIVGWISEISNPEMKPNKTATGKEVAPDGARFP